MRKILRKVLNPNLWEKKYNIWKCMDKKDKPILQVGRKSYKIKELFLKSK